MSQVADAGSCSDTNRFHEFIGFPRPWTTSVCCLHVVWTQPTQWHWWDDSLLWRQHRPSTGGEKRAANRHIQSNSGGYPVWGHSHFVGRQGRPSRTLDMKFWVQKHQKVWCRRVESRRRLVQSLRERNQHKSKQMLCADRAEVVFLWLINAPVLCISILGPRVLCTTLVKTV